MPRKSGTVGALRRTRKRRKRIGRIKERNRNRRAK